MQLPAITHSLSSPLLAPTKKLGPAGYSSRSTVESATGDDPESAQASESPPVSDSRKTNATALSETEFRVIAELKKVDREVRAHEAAHLAAAGGLARGGASFGYTQGPDGQRYAVSGEVSIDTSPGRDPEATILKAQRIQAAALAPSQPSGADRAIAAAAAQMAAAARAELFIEKNNPDESESEEKKPAAGKTGENDNPGTKAPSHSQEARTNPADGLVELFQKATSTEDALGNLLNTAV